MFCPNCKDEFRPGFERCASCNVALVADLSAAPQAPKEAATSQIPSPAQLADYCGFVSLEEARASRDLLRRERIGCDIVIREQPGSDPDSPIEEEFWLRIDVAQQRSAMALLGFDAAVSSEGFSCDKCGQTVGDQESFCSGCGARFD